MSQELIIKDTGIIARAELDVQINTAKAYPRDTNQCIEYAIQLATLDEATAQSCFYCLMRKEKDGSKKEIRGASIRLAEIMMCAWGNIHAATRIIENDGRHITAEGVAWDLQSNVKSAMQNKVSIRFGEKDGKGGYTANTDMQTVLSNAASAKALRNAIFKVVPKALVDRVLERAMTFSVGNEERMAAKRDEIFEKLKNHQISEKTILDFYEKKNREEITRDELRQLIGLCTAITEGLISAKNAFQDSPEETPAKDQINNLVKEKNATQINNNQAIESNKPSMYEQVKKQLESAKSLDTLQLAADLIREVESSKQQELLSIYTERQEKFK